jgi:hypothetical protein
MESALARIATASLRAIPETGLVVWTDSFTPSASGSYLSVEVRLYPDLKYHVVWCSYLDRARSSLRFEPNVGEESFDFLQDALNEAVTQKRHTEDRDTEEHSALVWRREQDHSATGFRVQAETIGGFE